MDTLLHNTTTNSSNNWFTLESIHPHKIILQAFYGIIASLGILGNVLVISVIVWVQQLRTLTNLFILHQSVIDLIGCIFIIIYNVAPSIQMASSGLGSVILCKIWLSRFVMYVLFTASTFNLVAVTLERYFAICQPLRYINAFTLKRARLIIISVWVTSILFRSYVAFGTRVIGSYCFLMWPNATFQHVFGTLTFILEYFLPLAVMLFAHISILCTVRASYSQHVALHGKSDIMDPLVKAQHNVIKTLILVFLAYVVCWTPNEILFFQYNLGGYLDFSGNLYHFSMCLVSCNLWVNPIIYALKYQQFQRGLRKMFRIENQVDVISGTHSNAAAVTMQHMNPVF
ncbi:galanin receptor 2b-like [Glandiceps talaboti]